MRLFLDRSHHFLERTHIFVGEAAGDGALEIGQVAVDAVGGAAPPGRRRDEEGAPVVGAHLAGDQPAVREPIEDARQRRPLVREATVKLGNRRRPRRGEEREDVRFALREAVLTQAREIQPDPMGRPMNRRHEA